MPVGRKKYSSRISIDKTKDGKGKFKGLL